MGKTSIDISTFANLRRDGCADVDKTDLLRRLVANTERRGPRDLAGAGDHV